MSFDIKKSAEELGITLEEMIGIYELFAGECSQALPELETFLHTGEQEKAIRLLHTLQGTAANLRLRKLADMVGSMGRHLRSGQPQSAVVMLPGVNQAVKELTSSLKIIKK